MKWASSTVSSPESGSSSPSSVRIGIQLDVCCLSDAYAGHIAFVHVADNPHSGQVRNSEWVRRRVGLHGCPDRHLLVGDHAGNRSGDINHSFRIIWIAAEQVKMLSRGIEGGLGVVLRVLRDLQVSQRNGPVRVQILRSIQLLARKELIGDGLVVGVEASRDVVTANTQKSWPFLTASPSRARMSTMRPEASEITGTVREMSGNTVPVTDNCDGALYWTVVTIG